MAKRTKPNYSVVWSETGSATKPADSEIRAGWDGGTKPPAEWMNWIQNRQDGYLAYLNQAGIPEWDSTSSYEGAFSYVQGSDNNVYKCLVSNTNKDPIDQPANASYWKIAFVANTDQFTRAVGSASAPTYSFEGDTNTGVYSTGADGVGVATGGVKRLEVNNSGAAVSGTLSATGKATFASPATASDTNEGATTEWVRDYAYSKAESDARLAPVAVFSFNGSTKLSDLMSNTTRISSTNDTGSNYFEYVLEFSGLPGSLSSSGGPGGLRNFEVIAGDNIGSYQVTSNTSTRVTLRVYHENNSYDTFTPRITGTLYFKAS